MNVGPIAGRLAFEMILPPLKCAFVQKCRLNSQPRRRHRGDAHAIASNVDRRLRGVRTVTNRRQLDRFIQAIDAGFASAALPIRRADRLII